VSNIIVTTGSVASGKSIWAKDFIEKNPNYVRFNRDDVRAMLNGGNPWKHFRSGNPELQNSVENTVTDIMRTFIVSNLKNNRNIIVDETNAGGRTFKEVCRILDKHNFAVHVEEKPFYIDLETALERDRNRTPNVGDDIVHKFFQKMGGKNFKDYKPKSRDFYELPVLAPITEEEKKKLDRVIICDLDGTLALFGDKNPYDRNFEDDDINKDVAELLYTMLADEYEWNKIIFVSGRKEKAREQTVNFLKKNYFDKSSYILYMRKDEDNRNDVITKYEIYRDNIHGKYNVLFVLDDRNKVVNMWRGQGLTCLQVAEGEF